jgi:hypothetical protein
MDELISGDQGRAPVRGRLAGVVLVTAGLAHLLIPGTLLATARLAYDRLLDVRFDPRAGAGRRVRLVGVGLVAAGAHLIYHGGVVPDAED